MFWLGKARIEQAAHVLLARVDYYLNKYGHCDDDQFLAGIVGEVPANHIELQGTTAQIAPPELPDFQFLIGRPPFGDDKIKRDISILGRGEFTSFGMVAQGERGKWFCYADGTSFPVRRAALRLVRELSTKHGITDSIQASF